MAGGNFDLHLHRSLLCHDIKTHISFFEYNSMKAKTPQGISLIELLLIISLLGILTSISISSLNGRRQAAQLESDVGSVINLLKAARSQAQHNVLIPVGAEDCAMSAYTVTWDNSNPPIVFQLIGTPHTSCTTHTAQTLKQNSLHVAVVLESVTTNLTGVLYSVPEGNVSFPRANGTPTDDVTLTFQSSDGRQSRTLYLDTIRGYPERQF